MALHWDFVKRPGKAARRHLFWYTSKPEVDLLYRDYRLLVRRTGNNPPLRVVEGNILEIHKRICVLETEAATVIQSGFRGMLARAFCEELRRQRSRCESRRICAVVMIQCAFRRWLAARDAASMRRSKRNHTLLSQFRKEQDDAKHFKSVQDIKALSMLAYKQEWKLAQSVRMLGKQRCTARFQVTFEC
jgi:hypothetical protein